jgi:alpha-L-fucosidase 2
VRNRAGERSRRIIPTYQFGGLAISRANVHNPRVIPNPFPVVRKYLAGVCRAVVLGIFAFSSNHCPASQLKLWYRSPGKNGNYGQAMFLGNGHIGGMTAGRVGDDRVYLNDSSLWTGTENLSGKYDEPNPDAFGSYQFFGTLNLNLPGQGSFTNYYRETDLGDAVARVSYFVGSTNYHREYFCSAPDDVLVIHLTADSPGAYAGNIVYADSHGATVGYTGSGITATGVLSGSGIKWAVNARVLNTGGTLAGDGNKIAFTGCDSLTIVVSYGTSYVLDPNVNFCGPDPVKRIASQAAKAAAKNYNSLINTHLADYHRLFDRVSLNLGSGQNSLPTDQRIAGAASTVDLELETLMFQNSRYLLIASSRPGGLPPNLQGLWTASDNPPWGADYHTDINIQMCLWAAETANLPECHQPLFDLVNSQLPFWRRRVGDLDRRMRPNGIPRGWTVRVSHNITGGMGWDWNTPGNAWYALHYWEHYLFSGDLDFLRTNAYPVMKESCQFWQDCLKTNAGGQLVAPYCWSPEHGNWEDGVSYNQELIGNLFNNFVRASEILDADPDLRAKVAQMREALLTPKIGRWGQLQEWAEDIDDPADEHRHTMHLVSVFPGAEITPDRTPALATAAKVSLIARGESGDSAAEWANVWRAAIWARLGDGEMAHHRLALLFADHEAEDNFVMNLRPEQWDGTLGASAAMIEMLLQSHEGAIHLLPALPSAWPSGAVTGLRTRGGFSVDMAWTNGWLTAATVHNINGTNCVVRYGQQSRQMTIPLGGSAQFIPEPPATPAPPLNVSATSIGPKLTITWNPVAAGLCAYNVKISAKRSGPYTILAKNVRATYFQAASNLSGKNYFVVSTVRGGVESADSAETE